MLNKNTLISLVLILFTFACSSAAKKPDADAKGKKATTTSSNSKNTASSTTNQGARVATEPEAAPHKPGKGKKKKSAEVAEAPKAEPKAEHTQAPAKEKPAKADKEDAAASAGTVTCSSGGEERKVEVTSKDGGCETIYTKGGKGASVANSANGTHHCESVRDKIVKHLTEAGYSCK